MSALALTYLSGADVEALALTDDEILDAVGGVLAGTWNTQTSGSWLRTASHSKAESSRKTRLSRPMCCRKTRTVSSRG